MRAVIKGFGGAVIGFLIGVGGLMLIRLVMG